MNNPSLENSFVNRELSWLEFNQRVLELAMDSRVKLLERVKFLAITASNLDEFFMVRVGSLKLSAKRGSTATDPAGFDSIQQLALIRERVIELNRDQDRCFLEQLEPELASNGILRLKTVGLNEQRMRFIQSFFQDEVMSAISPIAIGGADDFPVMIGSRLCMCIKLTSGKSNRLIRTKKEGDESGKSRYVLIRLTGSLQRIVTIPSDRGLEYLFIEDVIAMFLEELFPLETIEEWTTLRVTRNADFELDDDTEDFFAEMQQLLELRAKSQCIRLRVAANTSPSMRQFLRDALGLSDDDVYVAEGPLDLASLMYIALLPRFSELRDPGFPPIPLINYQENDSFFDRIAERDQLIFHPYQSYEPILDFLRQAAEDPNVIAIKQTLYRTSRSSKIVKALADAAQNGKHVTAIVELKARFDEERNMDWAEFLEKAGVDVVYGVAGFKIHAKLCIVVRREKSGIRRYLHFGTGNYNESTAGLYSDVSLFTCDPQMGMDAVHIFNAVTGLSIPQNLEKLALAPINLRETILELIRIEAANAEAGGNGQITAKLNSLVDPQMIEELYRASNCGVKIRLNVRGICCLRPGIPGLSENIRVVSIIDRFLEHSRILYFHHGGDKKFLITSADWMGRNLDRRIELLVPVEDAICCQRLNEVLEAYFKDNVNSWEILGNGKHKRLTPKRHEPFRAQEYIYDVFQEQYQSATNPRTTVFKAIRGSE